MYLKPERLEHGDAVGIIAPASAPVAPELVERALEAVECLGYRPTLGRNVRKRNGFLAGTDAERARDLMQMFADKRVKGIFCLRGGYGTGRLLPALDFQVIRANPKVLVGYSDITALHCAILRRSRMVSFHGPMVLSDFAKAEVPEFTYGHFMRTVGQPAKAGSICSGYHRKTVSVVRGGVVPGRLVGGNLSLLCSLIGTPWQPEFSRRILFFEELDEPPYRLDRMLTQMLNSGLLRKVAGVAVGINRNCEDPKARKRLEYRQTMHDVLEERLGRLRVPVVCGLPFGHVSLNATLPLGIMATLDGRNGDLVLDEPAVR